MHTRGSYLDGSHDCRRAPSAPCAGGDSIVDGVDGDGDTEPKAGEGSTATGVDGGGESVREDNMVGDCAPCDAEEGERVVDDVEGRSGGESSDAQRARAGTDCSRERAEMEV